MGKGKSSDTRAHMIERIPTGSESPADLADFTRIGAESFTIPYAVPVSDWTSAECHFVARDAQGRMLSALGVAQRTVIVGGTTHVPVGTIGGVMTAVAARKQGHASALLRESARYMRDELKLPFGLLQTADRNIAFYTGLGWQHMPVPMWFAQPGRPHVRCPENALVLQLGDAQWPEGEIDMNGWPW